MSIPPHPPAQAPRGSGRRRAAARLLLAAGFVLALFPVLHWNLGTAVSAMTYLVGVPMVITLVIVAVYFLDREPAASTALSSEETP